MIISDHLKEKIAALPTTAGCYLFKNKKDKVLYVGKAKNLKNRVRSYFRPNNPSLKTQHLMNHVVTFELKHTDTESEALILENNLIKNLRPTYNIRLKDDKSYPYIQINYNHHYPRLEFSHRPKMQKNVETLGPFVASGNITKMIRILTKVFQLRDCSDSEFSRRKTPCLLYQINQCSAPCVGYIDKESYAKDVESAADFFTGKGGKTVKALATKIKKYAEKEEFEKAAYLRDGLDILQGFNHRKEQSNILKSRSNTVDLDILVILYRKR